MGVKVPTDNDHKKKMRKFFLIMNPYQHVGDKLINIKLKVNCQVVTNYDKQTKQKQTCLIKFPSLTTRNKHLETDHRDIKLFICCFENCNVIFKNYK